MNKKFLLLIVIVAILGALVTMACLPPPPADCSPGFWKQPHHLKYWVGLEPGDDYNDEMTYLEALQGGKETRVSRFIVAGMLNAANPFAPCD